MRDFLAGCGGRRLLHGLGVLALAMLVTGTALASGGGEHGGGGLPQLNATSYPTQLFWLAISFAVLYFLMSGVALPKVQDVLDARDGRIAWDLTKTDELKNESGEIMAAVDESIGRARGQAHDLVAAAAARADEAAKANNERFEREIQRRLGEAEKRIAAVRTKALAEVATAAADVAQAVAARMTGQDFKATTFASAVKNVMGEQS